MMPVINGVMLAIGSSLAVSIVVKVTVVVVLGLAAAWLARRSSAAVRHALLVATFGATLVLPLAAILAPPVHVAVPVVGASRDALPAAADTIEAIPSVMTAADGAGVTPVTPQASRFSLSVLLLAGWIIGTAVFLLPVVTGLWQIRSLRRCGLPWLHGQSIAETLALDAGIHRRVEVLLHEALPGPITCGVLHPTIVLPQDAEKWKGEDLNRAIVHELEHVRRGDSATRYLARTVCALYWFHPLTWIAWRKLVLEAERSCDDAVLKGSEATAYADQLVGLAKRLPTAQRSPLLAMANRSDLSARVGAVLDSRQRRGRAGTFSVALACAAAAALVTAISPLMLVAAPQQAETSMPKFEVASVRMAPPVAGPITHSMLGGPGSDDPGQITYTNIALRNVLADAYEINRVDHIFGPDWLGSQLYTIVAKLPEGTTRQQFHLMLQNLLAERFRLTLHHETREYESFDLVIAKKGPKLKESSEGAAMSKGVASNSIALDGRVPLDKNGFPQLSGDGPGTATASVNGQIRTAARGQTLAGITRFLTNWLHSTVVDKTALSGKYDFTLAFAPAQSDGNLTEPAPDLLTAVEEQLGLKLVSAKESTDVLVIDHAEKVPTEN